MNVLLLLLPLLVAVAPAAADDIDIYLEAAGGPRRLVLVVDWQGVEAAAETDAMIDALLTGLADHAVTLASLPQPSGLAVSVLRPPGFDCGTWPGCAVGSASLSPPRDIATTVGRLALAADLVQLAAAAATAAPPAYTVESIWPALATALGTAPDTDSCGLPLVMDLIWSDVAVPALIDPGWRVAAQRHLVAAQAPAAVAQLASMAGAQFSVLAVSDDLPSVMSDALRAARRPGASLLSTAVPGFVPDPGRTGEEVLFPLFRPGGRQPWPGNLKALKLVPGDAGGPVIAQAPLSRPPVPGLDPADGGIARTALTFWTDPLEADVQAFDPSRGEVAGADGRSIRRGGVGQALPGARGGIIGDRNAEPGARQLFLLDGAPGEVLPALDATPETASSLGLAAGLTPDERLALLRWVRGQDVLDEDGDGERREPRRWLMGAVLHSRPVIVDYGPRRRVGLPTTAHDRRVLLGSNDGLLRLLDISAWDELGRQGVESWAALPTGLLGLQRQLLDRTVSPGHHYGVDGSPVVYREDRDGDGLYDAAAGDRVWSYHSLRRGGEQLYGLDITDPDQPRLLWQVSRASPGFAPLALGFSTPRLARMDLGEARPRLVLVLGGGYHGGWQAGARVGKDASAGADTLGNALFVIDAATGELLWRAHGPPHSDDGVAVPLPVGNLRHGFAAPVTVVDGDADGLTDRAYAADTGGNIWRLDLPGAIDGSPATPAEIMARWRVEQVAALGGAGEDDRRFFHALDVARTRDAQGDYEALVITSGDRAHAGDIRVRDHAYLIKDRGLQANPIGHAQLPEVGDACRDPTAPACAVLDLSRGWRLQLTAPGEKGLSAPLVRSGVAYFSTYRPAQPDERGCRPGIGVGALYAVSLSEGAPALATLYRRGDPTGNTDPPPGERAVVVGEGMPGAVVPWREHLILPGSGVEGRVVVDPGGPMRWRTHWRENGVD